MSMVIEYNNMQMYKKIPAHLMINLKLDEGKMWKRSDGRYVSCLWCYIIDNLRLREKQTFNCKMEEHMDILSGNINKTVVMYPMPKIMLVVDEVQGTR